MRSISPPRATLLALASVVLLAAGPIAPAAAQGRPWLGVYTQELSDDIRDGLDVSGDGILVNRVVEGSPADRAGLRKGDILVSFNARTLHSPDQLAEIVGAARVGQQVVLSVLRDGERRRFTATLAARSSGRSGDRFEMEAPEPPDTPDAPEAPEPPSGSDKKARVYTWDGDSPEGQRVRDHVRGLVGDLKFDSGDMPGLMALPVGRGRLGVRIESLTADLASAIGSPDTRGVFVIEVMKDTPAEKAGLKAGDVITAVDGKAVDDSDDLVRALRDEKGRVSLAVTRRGARRTVEAELNDSPQVFRWNRADGPMGFGRMGDDGKSYRFRVAPDAKGDSELRDELKELREQLRDLRRQLEEMKR